MRRYLIAILFVLVLVTPFVLRRLLGETSVAKPSSTATPLVVITPHSEEIRREFAGAFSAWYKEKFNQDVYIDYIGLATEDIRRLMDDRRDTLYQDGKGSYGIDVAWGGGDYVFDVQLKPHLKGVAIDPAILARAFPNPTLNGLPLYDLSNKPPHWYGAALSGFGITYNRPVVRYLQKLDPRTPEPKTWTDLGAPGYFGWLALADPGRSASSKQAFMAIVERAMVDAHDHGKTEDEGWQIGMGQVRMICSNARTFASGSSLIPGMIATGDAAAGTTIDYYGRSEVQAMGEDRLAYVQPVGATIINPDPIAMVLGVENHAPGREIIARRFIEFVLSEQGQLLWNKKAGSPGGPKKDNLRRLPIMPSVYDDMSDFTDKDNPYTSAAGFNKSPKREGTFGILGEIIDASCVDCLPELQQTRKVIESMKNGNRRRELEARLGRFPYDQKEALVRGAIWKKASPVEQLAIKRAWTDEFKAEYERLRTEASVP
jgi:ABC-type Fe3+ transport system substrate-binding protein